MNLLRVFQLRGRISELEARVGVLQAQRDVLFDKLAKAEDRNQRTSRSILAYLKTRGFDDAQDLWWTAEGHFGSKGQEKASREESNL